ncbi:MAG: DMT family transporter, partial [Eggerthellaceae bacterium]
LFLGAVASAACFVTWGVAVKHLGATTTTTYIYLVPAITATASILILGEPLNAPIILGLAMTIIGLLLSQKRSTNKRTQVARLIDRF